MGIQDRGRYLYNPSRLSDAVGPTLLKDSLSPDIQIHIGEPLVDPGLYNFDLSKLQRCLR